jgi:hypothetical protein
MPAGYWKGFKPDLISKDLGSQGGHAGYRAILWTSTSPGTFNAGSVIPFAEENDWPFIDSTRFTSDDMRSWFHGSQAVFPLGFDGLHSDPEDVDTHRCFPRWFDGDVVVYKFKTPWMTVEEENWQDAYGYAMINADGRSMALYHLWGDRANLVVPQ